MIIRMVNKIKEDTNKCEFQGNTNKQLNEVRKTVQGKKNFNKYVEILGKNQMEILEVKISVCQRKTERLQKD
jgi:hypothetical protein